MSECIVVYKDYSLHNNEQTNKRKNATGATTLLLLKNVISQLFWFIFRRGCCPFFPPPLMIMKHQQHVTISTWRSGGDTWSSTCRSHTAKGGMITKNNFLWSPIQQIWYTVKRPLFFFLSNQGLGAFSPTELPYPSQASVFEARQLKRRLMESPRVLAVRAQSGSLGLNFGIRTSMQWVTIISNISVRLLRQQVCEHRRFDLSQRCTFQFFRQQHLGLSTHGCSLCGNSNSIWVICCLLWFYWYVLHWCKCAVIR